jgi:hypothetical protein
MSKNEMKSKARSEWLGCSFSFRSSIVSSSMDLQESEDFEISRIKGDYDDYPLSCSSNSKTKWWISGKKRRNTWYEFKIKSSDFVVGKSYLHGSNVCSWKRMRQ